MNLTVNRFGKNTPNKIKFTILSKKLKGKE